MNQLTYNWWAVALRGVLAIILGLFAFLLPGITLAVIVALVGIVALLDGIFLFIAGFRSRKEDQKWWVLILQGILSLGVGILAFIWPIATAVALLYLVAVWAIASGMVEIVAAIRLRKEIKGEWLLVLDGILTMLFGLVLIWVPPVGLLVMVYMIGAFKLISGILLLILAFRLRKMQRQNDHTFTHAHS